jgi:hypothetical protein
LPGFLTPVQIAPTEEKGGGRLPVPSGRLKKGVAKEAIFDTIFSSLEKRAVSVREDSFKESIRKGTVVLKHFVGSV